MEDCYGSREDLGYVHSHCCGFGVGYRGRWFGIDHQIRVIRIICIIVVSKPVSRLKEDIDIRESPSPIRTPTSEICSPLIAPEQKDDSKNDSDG